MRFSIFALLAMTGYVAVATATFVQPFGMWRFGTAATWMTVTVYLSMLACDPVNRGQAVFGRISIAGIAVYVVLTLPNSIIAADRTGGLLPHEMLVEVWASNLTPSTVMPRGQFLMPPNSGEPPKLAFIPTGVPVSTVSRSQWTILETTVAAHCALLFGLLCGCLALCRSRHNDRRCRRELQLKNDASVNANPGIDRG